MCHNCWAHTLEPVLHKRILCNKKSGYLNERVAPAHQKNLPCSNEDPAEQLKKNYKKKY